MLGRLPFTRRAQPNDASSSVAHPSSTPSPRVPGFEDDDEDEDENEALTHRRLAQSGITYPRWIKSMMVNDSTRGVSRSFRFGPKQTSYVCFWCGSSRSISPARC